MKPYVMLYSETTNINLCDDSIHESTRRSFSIEANDDDYLNLIDWTTVTEASEATDDDFISHASLQPDLFLSCYESTIITRTIESDDTDYLDLSTIRTNTVESSDEDYITLM